jgi:DNA-binding MarR family transcriptional regulator
MNASEQARRVEAVRRFNRFYTRQIGLLQEHLWSSPFALTEARVIYELAQHEQATAKQLGEELELDAGYLSRLLRGLQKRRLIVRRPSAADGRAKLITRRRGARSRRCWSGWRRKSSTA